LSLIDEARQLWSSAFFVRRAKDRDRSVAAKVLRHLSTSPHKPIAGRATEALAEHESDKPG